LIFGVTVVQLSPISTGDLFSDVEVNKWYPFKRLRDIEATVIETYENAGPILERAGEKSPRLDNSVKSNILYNGI